MISPALLARASSVPRERLRSLVETELGRAESFRALPRERQRKIASDTQRVLEFIADPSAGLAGVPAEALADPAPATFAPPSGIDEQVNKDFDASAVQQGTQQFEQLVDTVDFPRFVAGLIEGVFTSIVDSSIRQMNAYGAMLENVVKSVEQFARENISEQDARQGLADRFPDVLRLGDGPEPRLALNEDVEDGSMPDFRALFGLGSDVDFEDGDSERRLVLAQQVQMARQRQQLLATMVLMGINRIVVTEGEIKASVVFDVKSRDFASRNTNQSADQTQLHRTQKRPGFWNSLFDETTSTTQTTVTTQHADMQNQSVSEVEAKAKLSGSVVVKFRSETFPLERMASALELGAVQEKSER